MRLRARLLLLIALLLAGVLAGSFVWLFSGLRQQFAANLDASLDSAVTSFRAGESQRFRTLEVMASSLEASPSFRSVLRKTDQATLADFVQSTAEGLEVDLILVTDGEGKLQAGNGPSVGTSEHPAAQALRQWAGQTSALRDYWWFDGVLYQGASVPLVDGQDYVDGYLSVAYRIDQPMVGRLAKELDARIELLGGKTPLVSDSRGGDGKGYLRRTVPLGSGPSVKVAQLAIVRSLAPIEAFVHDSRSKLLSLATVAFLLAIAASFPLVGRVAYPLEALQKAQAEMEAIFSASLDGLVALDERGVVSTANPAAAVALGREVSALVGMMLGQFLPETVVRELSMAPDGVHQRANFERAGRLYKIHRTFVRQRASLQVGSILLLHDVTEEQAKDRQVSSFLRHLCERLEITDSPWRVRVGLSTLRAWASPELASSESRDDLEAPLAGWLEEFSQSLPVGRSCRLDADGHGPRIVAMPLPSLRALVEILLENALLHGSGNIVLGLRKSGGCLEISVDDEGEQPLADLAAALKGPGLGLKVARDLCQRYEGHLEVGPGPDHLGTRSIVSFPRSGG